MNFDAVTIERMVREVLSQTQRPANIRANATAPRTSEKLLTVPSVGAPAQEKPASTNVVLVRDRIVTADVLQEIAKPGSKIIVARKAILTPAAQDYLRNSRITLERADASPAESGPSLARWRILVSGVAEHTIRAVEVVCQQRGNVQRELIGSASESVNAAVSAISRAEVAGVLVVTTSPEVVACKANRQPAVRATVVADLASWSRVQPQLKPNVVCVSPQGRSFMELQNLLNKVVTGPAPEAPSEWS